MNKDNVETYENIYDYTLPDKLPVIIRVDGRRFSNFVRKIKADRPFDGRITDAMVKSVLAVCADIDGCVLGYTQSDEATFVIRNDKSESFAPWFRNRIQKITSISASMFTAHFNKELGFLFDVPAYFDSRVFTVPDINTAIYTLVKRQRDCITNSISTACYCEVKKARRLSGPAVVKSPANFIGLKKEGQLEILQALGVDWNTYQDKYKYGVMVYRIEDGVRNPWFTDGHLPIFSENIDFLQKIINK